MGRVQSYDEIGEARAAFTAAIARADADGAGSVYTEDARLQPPSVGLIEGRPSITKFWAAGIGVGVSHAEFDPVAVRHQNGLAYEIGPYALRIQTGRESAVERGTYLVVHERQPDGTWLRAAEMFSADGMPSAQPKEENA